MKNAKYRTYGTNVVEFHKSPESKHRKDSFWFDGVVASTKIKSRTFCLIATGHVDVVFKPDGEAFENDMARKEARSLGLGDKRLNKISDHDGWLNNNWFSVFEEKKDGSLNYFEPTEINYDDAIQMLLDVAREETK